MKNLVKKIVVNLCDERERNHRAPVVAMENEIIRTVNEMVKQALEELTAECQLHRTENVNRIPMYSPEKSHADKA